MANKRRTRLAQFMRRTGTSDKELGRELGVNTSTIFRIRTQRVAPSGKTIRRLVKWSNKAAEAHGITPLSVEEIIGL